MHVRKIASFTRNHSSANNRQKLLVCLAAFGLAAMLFPDQMRARLNSQSNEIRSLTAGGSLERELAGGQSHSYRITLAQGQYLEAIVEQRGIDVVVVVVAPDGQKLLEVDSPNGTQGPEPVWMIAETAGEYRLEVRSLEKNAAVGRYEVLVKQLRAPTEQDRSRISALRAFGEASQLRQQGTVEAVRQAVAKYQESLLGWQLAQDQVKEAETLSNLGFLCFNYLGDTPKAREYLERELPLRRVTGNQEAEAVALNNLGQIYFSLGEMQKALDNYNQSLTLRRTRQDRRGEAVVLDHLGQVYNRTGQLQLALEHQQRALAIFRALNEVRHTGVALANLSDTLARMGEYEKALEFEQEAITLMRAVKDQLQEAIFLNNAGAIYFNLGEWRKALDSYQQALALHRKSGNRQQEAYTLTNIGSVAVQLSEYDQSLDNLRQALSLHRAAGARRGEATTLFQLGVVYRLTGNPQQAKESLEVALALSQAVEDPDLEATIRDALSLVAQELGDLPAARQFSERAIELTESIRATVTAGQSRSAFLASKQSFYEHYIDLLMRMPNASNAERNDVVALKVSEQARARSLLELLAEARTNIRQGVDASLLAQEQTLQQRLNVKAEAQTRLLSGKHTDAQAATLATEIATLTGQLQNIEAQIRAASPRYAALTQPQPLTVPKIQSLLDDDTLLLEFSLGEKNSYLWLVSPTSVVGHRLPPRAEIEQAARQVYESLTARQPKPGLTEAQQIERVKTAEAEFPAQAATLSQMLLAPVAAQLGKKRLVIVAPGVLEYLPFAALPEPQSANNPQSVIRNPQSQPLIANHEIVNLPSASVLSVLRREAIPRQVGTKAVAVLADPVFAANDPRVAAMAKTAKPKSVTPTAASSVEPTTELNRAVRSFNVAGRGDLSRLPFSREEADTILSLAPTGKGFKALGFAANRAAATNAELAQYRIVHFATHGFLNSEHPELSGLVFSLVDETGKPQDGFLRLHEIYNLRLPADLVVLSACQTALGKQIKGEGLVGLTRGFMHAGTLRVVASLWQVDDLATAELMKLFYRGMLKDSQRPAAALRNAQLELMKQRRWASPYYWAAFVMQGEWR
ncbi:MAG: CHAT domain-containing tetratricopeptide repeat protein [Blastocatellia bacterium]